MHSFLPLLPLSVGLSHAGSDFLKLTLGPLPAPLALRSAPLEALELRGQIQPLLFQRCLGLLQRLPCLGGNTDNARWVRVRARTYIPTVCVCACVPPTLLLLSSCSWRLSMAALCFTLSSDSCTSWRRVSSSTHRWSSLNSASRRDLCTKDNISLNTNILQTMY